MAEARRWHFWRADVWNAIATILLVVVGVFGIASTNRSLELSERAWIGVGGTTVTQLITTDQPLRYAVQLINTGKQPAIDISFAQDTRSVPRFANNDLANMNVIVNDTCTGLQPAPGAGLVLPNASLLHSTDSGRGNHPVTVDDHFLKGDSLIITMGCVAYRAFGKVHHTAYCDLFFENPPTPGLNSGRAPTTPSTAPLSAPGVPAAAPPPGLGPLGTPPPPSASFQAPPGYTLVRSECLSGNSAD